MKVLELMKTHIIKAGPESTLPDAVDLMDLYQLTSLPVVDSEGHLLGVVAERDLIHAMLPECLRPQGMSRIAEVRNRRVTEIMSKPAISVDENADVREAVEIMLSCELKRLPVTSEERVVGVINRIDVCQAMLEGQIETV